MIERKQGDSYGLDIRAKGLTTLDSNWTGKWALVPTLGEAAVASGTLGKSEDLSKFLLRIKPSDTETIPVGTYMLVVEIRNPTIEFCEEIIQEPFNVKQQGIPVAG